MRGYFASVIAFAAIVPSIALARSDDIPTLDMKPICRGIASQSADPGVAKAAKPTPSNAAWRASRKFASN